MKEIVIFVDDMQKKVFSIKSFEMLDFSFSARKNSDFAELQCFITASVCGKRELSDLIRIEKSSVLTFATNEFDSYPYSQDKIKFIKEVHDKSNMGYPHNNQFHVSVDSAEKYLVFANGDSDLFFGYIWSVNKDCLELSLSNVGSYGNEQWMRSYIETTQTVHLLYL